MNVVKSIHYILGCTNDTFVFIPYMINVVRLTLSPNEFFVYQITFRSGGMILFYNKYPLPTPTIFTFNEKTVELSKSLNKPIIRLLFYCL